MSIRSKVALIVLGIFLAAGAVNFAVQHFIIYPGFVSLEREEAVEDLKRVREALSREVHHLSSLTHDWAAWDDTYDFVESRDPEYLKSNLEFSTFSDNALNLLYYYNSNGKVVWGECYDLDSEEKITISDFPQDRLPQAHVLNSFWDDQPSLAEANVSGIFMTELGPMKLAARPILQSSNIGPARGTLIMGRLLNAAAIETLSEQTQVDLRVVPLSEKAPPEPLPGILNRLNEENPYLVETATEGGLLQVYSTYPDIQGRDALFLEVRVPRSISRRGLATLNSAMISIVVAGLAALLLILALLRWTVLDPITQLTDHAMKVRDTGDLSQRVLSERPDEVGILANEFDDMLVQLESNAAELENMNLALKRDIDMRKQTETALQESEAHLRVVLDATAEGILVTGPRGNVRSINQRFAEMWQVPNLMEAAGVERNLESFMLEHLEDPEDFLAKIKQLNGTNKKSSGTIKRQEGEIFEWFTGPVELSNQEHGRLWSFRDVTQRIEAERALKESEEKFARAKKMESLGLLAGGVAHDLNNVLSGIVAYPDLLLMELPEDSPLREPLQTIQESGLRAAGIVQDLLTLARGVAAELSPISLNDAIEHYLHSPECLKLKKSYPNVSITTRLDPGLLRVYGSSNHAMKVVMNLVTNAMEALSNQGLITITTENRYLEKPLNGYENISVGEYAVLSISDNGSGIPPENLERIFEPFYTRKIMGQSGTGLGLAVVWSVVHNLHGYIDVMTGADGTTFEMFFPITRAEIPDEEVGASIDSLKGNGEVILIVDDEVRQREIGSKLLGRLGYEAHTVSSGEEGVAFLSNNEVDLVLLDMIMDPGINGCTTYEKMIQLRPGQKALVVSGYAETEEVKRTQELGAGSYLKKPFTLEALGAAVKKELQAERRHVES